MGIFAWMKGRRERQEEAPPLPVPALGYQTGALQGIGSREDQEDAFAFVNDKDVVNIQREGLFAVVAMLIYLLVIREAVECIRLRAETVYEVARIARSGYEWITGKCAFLLQLHDLLRKV